MQLLEVNIDDVYPLKDEYGNDLARRDYSLKVNKDYVHELAAKIKPKGEPDELVSLVQDGGIYRIIAGNSRVEAMREIGTKRFKAIVYEEMSIPDAIAVAIRTNTKKKYEASEELQNFVQLSAFASEDYIAEQTGEDRERIKLIRTAHRLAGDQIDKMTFEWASAIAEFRDDQEAVDELTNCKESEWKSIYKDLVAMRDAANKRKDMVTKIEYYNIDLLPDAPADYLYRTMCTTPADIDSYFDGHYALGHIAVLNDDNPHYPRIMLYQKTNEEDTERAELKRKADEIEQSLIRSDERRKMWYCDKLSDFHKAKKQPMGNVADLIIDEWMESEICTRISIYDEDLDTNYANQAFTAALAFAFIDRALCIGRLNYVTRSIVSGKSDEWNIVKFASYLDAVDACISDGYEPEDWELELIEMVKAVEVEE